VVVISVYLFVKPSHLIARLTVRFQRQSNIVFEDIDSHQLVKSYTN